MDLGKQIEYRDFGAEEDLAAARSLLEKKHFRHALFFAHLAIEKMLKAHVTRETKTIPPRTHNLLRLAEVARLPLSPEQRGFLGQFGVYQSQARYPDSATFPLKFQTARQRLLSAEEMVTWLTGLL